MMEFRPGDSCPELSTGDVYGQPPYVVILPQWMGGAETRFHGGPGRVTDKLQYVRPFGDFRAAVQSAHFEAGHLQSRTAVATLEQAFDAARAAFDAPADPIGQATAGEVA